MANVDIEALKYYEIFSYDLDETRAIEILMMRAFGNAYQIIHSRKNDKVLRIIFWATDEEKKAIDKQVEAVRSQCKTF